MRPLAVAHAAELQIGASGKIDQSVAMLRGGFRYNAGFRRTDDAARDAQTHQQAIAAFHRPQRAGAPAFDERGGVHSAASDRSS